MTVSQSLALIAQDMRDAGFARTPAAQMRSLLPPESLADWASFADSWNDLSVDAYMADSGRYRRRRFSAFALTGGPGETSDITRKPHQPHYQSRDYNPLNGGIERWFDPFKDEIASHPTLQAILGVCFKLFDGLTPPAQRPKSWHVECHQFRIEARVGEHGQPTPEGLHRDGVDWVLVMLVTRENIAEGVTSIHDVTRKLLGRFTLTEPLDAAFVDDSRVYHGVTAVTPDKGRSSSVSRRARRYVPPRVGGSSHFRHARNSPSFSARPSGVTTHGRSVQGGLCRTC